MGNTEAQRAQRRGEGKRGEEKGGEERGREGKRRGGEGRGEFVSINSGTVRGVSTLAKRCCEPSPFSLRVSLLDLANFASLR